MFNPRHIKSGMYTEGMGQQKTNSRGANDLGDGKWADKPGGEFAGGADPGWIAIPSARDDARVRWRSACRQYLNMVLRLVDRALLQVPQQRWTNIMFTYCFTHFICTQFIRYTTLVVHSYRQ
jgi:hypothetical protein